MVKSTELKKIYVVIDKEKNKSIVNDNMSTSNKVCFWDEIGGHSEGSVEYLKECKKINDAEYLNRYIKLYY